MPLCPDWPWGRDAVCSTEAADGTRLTMRPKHVLLTIGLALVVSSLAFFVYMYPNLVRQNKIFKVISIYSVI